MPITGSCKLYGSLIALNSLHSNRSSFSIADSISRCMDNARSIFFPVGVTLVVMHKLYLDKDEIMIPPGQNEGLRFALGYW